MAVAVILEFEGATIDQYEQVVDKMGVSDGNLAPGGIFHWVTVTDDGFRVTDVWESREQFEKFAEDQIGPLTQEVGITSEPQITVFEVHNHLSA
jgi:hypothetical protein